MKYAPYLLIATICITLVGGIFMNKVYASEKTIAVNGVNYVSLKQMAKTYHFAIESGGGEATIKGKGLTLSVATNSNVFSVNDTTYIALELPHEEDNQMWISAKDWAQLFDLSLTNYNNVSKLKTTKTEPVKNEEVSDPTTYNVDKDWGDKVPEGVRKHGSVDNIETPYVEAVIYKSSHRNKELEKTVQGE